MAGMSRKNSKSVMSHVAAFLGFLTLACAPIRVVANEIVPAPVSIPMEDKAIKAASIVMQKVTRDQVVTNLSLPGTVAIPQQQLRAVSAPADGLVESMLVAADEHVSAGQPIATLRSPDVIEAQRQFLAAIDDRALADDRLRRAQSLVESRAISEREFREAQNAATQARSRLDEKTYLLSLMELSTEDIETLRATRRLFSAVTIHAPKSGTIIKRHTSAGERVDAAAPLFTIADLDPLWVNVQVPATRIAAVTLGAKISLPAQTASGRVIRIGQTVDPNTQSVNVVAEINTNGKQVRPGLSVLATIHFETSNQQTWVVPVTSVVRHRERFWVFVRTKEGFEARPIGVIAENARSAAVQANLDAPDEVVSSGIISLLPMLAAADKN